MEIKQADFVKSSLKSNSYPEFLGIEFAFVGKSNVGKSSLINSLTRRNKLAKTSKTPGRTQLINFFLINRTFHFVDLPGYGFAKVPLKIKEEWGKLIEEYLHSERKKIVFLLLDIRRIPSDEDKSLIEWLEFHNVDFKIIFTKVDKFSNNQRFNQLKEIKKSFQIDKYEHFFHSSLSNDGREKILNYIGKEIELNNNDILNNIGGEKTVIDNDITAINERD
ncbi:MAG: YihA family ribosome biogenesis GTP-binding protein [Fusobacteria bacterium]|nr:YihA family ribosome biogenesis GTP-binding protein [Fusobacteriota bacterium]